jgi:hypothetical protein
MNCVPMVWMFQPLTRQFDEAVRQAERARRRTRYLRPGTYSLWLHHRLRLPVRSCDQVYDYRFIVDNDLRFDFQQGRPIFPGVSPGWDNSPRRPADRALILHGSTPERFGAWLEGKIKATDWTLLPLPFLFVNAWNEWAEGNHLEPCERWGLAYLEALKQAVDRISGGNDG